MDMSFWGAFGRQLAHPQGLAGRVTGSLMRLVNRHANILTVDALNVQAYNNVLEMGFGPGEGIARLAALAPKGMVFGIDHSATMLAQATRRNAKLIRRGRVRLRQSTFDSLPLADASIDRILAVNVIYFWHDGAAVMKELRRVMRPGGRLAIYATEVATMRKWKFAGSHTHRHFDDQNLRDLLRDGGFDPDDIAIGRVVLAPGIFGLIATADAGCA